MVKHQLSLFRHRTRFFMKKKDKNVRGNNMNNFNGGGDGEKKKEMDPSKVQQTMKLLELENTESDHGRITEFDDKKADAFIARFREQLKLQSTETLLKYLEKLKGFGGSDDDNNGDGGGDEENNGGGDDDNNGGGGGKNNKKGRDGDGDGDGDGDRDGDKNKSDRDSDGGGGEMKGKNMDFMGKAGFGYRYRYHAGNENEYPVGQRQCAQEVQSPESKCLFYHAIMIR